MILQRKSRHNPIDLNALPRPASSVFADNDNNNDHQHTNNVHHHHNDDDDDCTSSASDCESSVTGGSGEDSQSSSGFSTTVLIKVDDCDDQDRLHRLIKQRFLSAFSRRRGNELNDQNSSNSTATEVVAIHRRNWTTGTAQASIAAFQIYSQALAEKHRGNAGGGDHDIVNAKYAWFVGAAGSKSGVERIVSHGFGYDEIVVAGAGGGFGQGVHLSSDEGLPESLQSTAPDEDGLRHVLLCRVLLGKTEEVSPGSTQTHPSSPEFDSGVDCLLSPKNYVVWFGHMNTHILPEFVVTFRTSPTPTASTTPSTTNTATAAAAVATKPHTDMPRSPWMSFPALIAVLSGILPAETMRVIGNKYREFKDRRIKRDELVRIIRQLAGDRLLTTVIKSCKSGKKVR